MKWTLFNIKNWDKNEPKSGYKEIYDSLIKRKSELEIQLRYKAAIQKELDNILKAISEIKELTEKKPNR